MSEDPRRWLARCVFCGIGSWLEGDAPRNYWGIHRECSKRAGIIFDKHELARREPLDAQLADRPAARAGRG